MVGNLLSLTAVYLMLFFVGMRILQEGLFQLSYQRMKQLLANFTRNIYLGIFTGMVTTAILQSSSLVMILAIGFVSIGMLTFKQSLGIILGANIGTTITGEIMTFSHVIPEVSFVIIGVVLLLFKNRLVFGIGALLVGLGSIFVALNGFESLAAIVGEMPIFTEALQYTIQEPLIGVVVGTMVSGIIQSSSATIGITMSFLHEGLLQLPASIAITLGANIGTCVTSLLAIIGAKKDAKLVAMAHVWFNIIGVLIFLPFIVSLSTLAEFLASNSREQLAHISVLFNIISVLLFLPFINLFEMFIRRLHTNKA